MLTSQERRIEARRAAAADHAVRTALAHTHGGKHLRNAVRSYWRKATFTTWDEAVLELSRGIRVLIHCDDAPAGKYGHGRHWIDLNPNGSVDLFSHPQTSVDVETEAFMSALGANLSSCRAAATFLPTRAPIPKSTYAARTIDVPLRTLHTAVLWAQHPNHEWTPEWGDAVLRAGITPDLLDQWVTQGWDADMAIRFLQQRAAIDVADAWRANGDLSLRAAKQAGAGEYPDREQRWTEVGFTKSKSARWRSSGLTPQEAWVWEQAKVAPGYVASIRRAAQTLSVDAQTYRDWCVAGIPAKHVVNWHTVTRGDVEVALAWHGAGLEPRVFLAINDWNRSCRSTRDQITLEQTIAYMRVGIGERYPEQIRRAIDCGLTPQDYAEALEVLAGSSTNSYATFLVSKTPPSDPAAWWVFGDDPNRLWAVNSMRKGYSPAIPVFVDHLCTKKVQGVRTTGSLVHR